MDETVINFLSYLKTIKEKTKEENLNFEINDQNFQFMYFQYLTSMQIDILRDIKIELKCIANDLETIKSLFR